MAPRRSPKKKKAKIKRHEGDETPNLGIDALAHVMDFLAPRDLYRLAFTCKGLSSRVSIPQVVKSALFHGGRPQATIESLLPLMENEQIHPVSPLRLLRLINAKRCECCNITAVTEESIGRYGVAFCRRRCLDPCEDTIYYRLPLYPVGDESNHNNEACNLPYWKRLQCLYRNDFESCTGWNETGGFHRNDGTPCGPIFALQEVVEAFRGPSSLSRYWNERDHELANKTREDRVKELLEDRLPPPSTSYQDFVKTYREFHKKAKERLAKREEVLKRKREERGKRQYERLRKELKR